MDQAKESKMGVIKKRLLPFYNSGSPNYLKTDHTLRLS